MGGVAIKASFGKDEQAYNGLKAILDELLEKPLEEHYVICKVRNSRTNVDHDNGGVATPTVKFVHIEPMITDTQTQAAKSLFEEAAKARLGDLPQQTLFEDTDEDEDEDDALTRPWAGDVDFIAPVTDQAADTKKAPRKRAAQAATE